MINPFRRWFAGGPQAPGGSVRAWAAAQGWRYATSRDLSGFVVEPGAGSAPWRCEWGPSQRGYIDGNELRVRVETGETGDLQMLCITRALMQVLESEVFEQYTEGTQTRMDDSTPEEMRWLVLHPQVPRATLGALKERYAMLSNRPAAAPMWLEGALAEQLEASSAWLSVGSPLAMVVQRGRFVLRLGVAEPGVEVVEGAIALANVAAAAARRVGREVMAGAVGSQRPSSWGAPSAMPNPTR
jgi:hypothetical protein